LAKQINLRIAHFIKLQDAEFTRVLDKLSSLSPLGILARGYSITFQCPEGKTIKEAQTIRVGDTIRTKLHKGELICNVKEVHSNG
jgi:exodeoxyribonuclease VII large subunit